MLPLLAAGSAALGSIYTVGKAVDSFRYWNDYYRNTGYRPKYSFRSGMYDWGLYASMNASYTFNNYSYLKKLK